MTVDCNVGDGSYPEDRPENYSDPTWKMPRWDLKEDIVISGISGRFPESDSVEELKYNLYEGVDMITENDRRWRPGLLGTPKRMGKLKDIVHFDSEFFGYTEKEAQSIDPMHRLLLEGVYECIFDAGYEPSSLRGKNIGVFVGCSEKSVFGDSLPIDELTGDEIMGTRTSFLSNRISFIYGFTGPCLNVDTACSSTMHALNEAFLALKTNRCDAAIVGGATISLSVHMSVSFSRLGLISQEGTCKVFDATANGYVRSEAVGAIFLQRASDARRCYTTILHSKLNNDGAKQEGISFPSARQQKQLFKEVYCEMGYNPAQIDYVEAHGTGTVAGDREESNAIADFFLPGRKSPLLVGSVKSNLGHAEAASGTCTLAKVILAMEEAVIPPNLHYKEANPHVPAMVEGKMHIIREKTPWKPGIVAVNNFGFGGSNAHLVLKANQKENLSVIDRKIPRLVLVCGRKESSVKHLFEKMEQERFSDEALVLLEEACRAPTSGMRFRGYGLVQEPGKKIQHVIQEAPNSRPPVWFLFSGMGSQWSGMAKDMMKLEVFANSIRRSAQILKPLDINLLHLLTVASDDELNTSVSSNITITAIQIALVDIMKSLGIVPDGIIGHSLGELACAYADGCFTAEQVLLTAFWRGNSCNQAKLIKGAMADVDLSWEEVKKYCPNGVFPVCHNSESSVTISGSSEAVKNFVKRLSVENISCRLINTGGVAFHTKYVEPAAQLMRKELNKVLPNPVPRTSRWLSSSVPESKWTNLQSQVSSIDYHINNMLSPVLFKETMSKVPKNAIIIEFSPSSLLEDEVKKILGTECTYVGFMMKEHEDTLNHCLNAIGQLYVSSLNPVAKNLYDEIKFPVSRGTAMLNSLIKWDHEKEVETWHFTTFHETKDNIYRDIRLGQPYEFLAEHVVDGKTLFPIMGYVELAWKTLGKELVMDMEELPIIVEDLNVLEDVELDNAEQYVFKVKDFDAAGNFRIERNGRLVASGKIRTTSEDVMILKDSIMQNAATSTESITLNSQDFYKELKLKGFEYGSAFQNVLSADSSGESGEIRWDGQWITFMDAMVQIPVIAEPLRTTMLPRRIKSIRIDPKQRPEKKDEVVPFFLNPRLKSCCAGPVEIQGLEYVVVTKSLEEPPVVEEHVFVPLYDSLMLNDTEQNNLKEYSEVCTTLAHKIAKSIEINKRDIFIANDREVAPELVRKYIGEKNPEHTLLKALRDVLNDNMTKTEYGIVQKVLLSQKEQIRRDVLATVSLKETSLRSALQVVQNNQSSSSVKILEVSGHALCGNEVMKYLELTAPEHIKISYKVACGSQVSVQEGCFKGASEIVRYDVNNAYLPGENDLVLLKDLLTDNPGLPSEILKATAKAVKENGFLLLMERTSLHPVEKFVAELTGEIRQPVNERKLEDNLKNTGLKLISKKSDGGSTVLYLLRKLSEKKKQVDEMIHITGNYSWVEPLKAKLKENLKKNGNKIWLVSDETNSGVMGLVNSLKMEPGGKYLRCVFNEDLGKSSSSPRLETYDQRLQEIFEKDLVYNVFKNGEWGTMCHRTLPSEPKAIPRKEAYLKILNRGDLSSLRWIESNQANLAVHTEKLLEIKVYMAPLNTLDVMLATGELPLESITYAKERTLGMEFAGRDITGRRVMGVLPYGGLATSVLVPSRNIFPVPKDWTLEEASTVPIAYITAYYALIVRGEMKKGESVLIHSGTDAVGQAAISIALSMNCQVFVTVGSEKKTEIIKGLFPEIRDDHISSSQDLYFEFNIMNVTHGEGVDLIVNSLPDDKRQASVRCIKTHGRFLEIGRMDMAKNKSLRMSIFLKNISFQGISIEDLLSADNILLQEEVNTLLKKGIDMGVVRPLNRYVFQYSQVQDAFKFLANDEPAGKVVIKLRQEEDRNVKHVFGPAWIPSIARTYCDPGKSYVVTGTDECLRFELAGWLVEKGAKHLVLSSTFPLKTQYQKLWINRWKKQMVNVLVDESNLVNAEETKQLLTKANNLAPVGGIFHLDMLQELNGVAFVAQDRGDFEKACIEKLNSIHQLDILSRDMCSQLDYFVVSSSSGRGRENAGQSSYAYANSVTERMIENRRKKGLPGLAIKWGAIEDFQSNEEGSKAASSQSIRSCLDVLDRCIQGESQIVTSSATQKYCISL